jgi:hypothetical protein
MSGSDSAAKWVRAPCEEDGLRVASATRLVCAMLTDKPQAQLAAVPVDKSERDCGTGQRYTDR